MAAAMKTITREEQLKAARTKNRRYPPKTASYTLRKMFAEMVERDIMVKDVAEKIRQHPNSLSTWRSGASTPSILTVEEFAHAIGLKLALVELEPGQEKSEPAPYAGVLTDTERQVVDSLAAAWNAFLVLPVLHNDDVNEFRRGIHQLQEKVFARYAIKRETL